MSEVNIFDAEYLGELTAQAQINPRKRQHRNIHHDFKDSCQRLFNAIEPGSYIRPHRHATDSRDELLIAVRGLLALVTFDDYGNVTGIVRFGSDRHGEGVTVGAELQSKTWHTVIALEAGSILLEVKRGPFDPNQPKDFALWAPNDNDPNSQKYLQLLVSKII